MKCNINERKNDVIWLVDALENFEYHIVSLMLDDMCCTKKQSDPTVRMKSTICQQGEGGVGSVASGSAATGDW